MSIKKTRINVHPKNLNAGHPEPLEIKDGKGEIQCEEIYIHGSSTLRHSKRSAWLETDGKVTYKKHGKWFVFHPKQNL